MALLESIGDPTLTMGLAFIAFANWFDVGEFGEILRWSQTVIDLAAGDPAKGAGFGWDHRWRSRWHCAALLGGGWAVPDGAKTSTTPSRWPDTATRQPSSGVVAWTYGFAMQYGVLRADDSAVRAIEEAVQTAQRASNDRRTGLGRVHVGCRAAESGRRGRPSPRAGADGAGPRHLAARALPSSWSRSPSCGPPGKGPGAATAMLPFR